MASATQQQQMPPAYQEKVEVLQKANAQLRELVTRQQQYDAQHTENAMVKQELDALRSDEPVFKLHGKVLVRQDPQEAKAIVGQRLKMIEGELTKLSKTIGETQTAQGVAQQAIRDWNAQNQAQQA